MERKRARKVFFHEIWVIGDLVEQEYSYGAIEFLRIAARCSGFQFCFPPEPPGRPFELPGQY